LFTPLRDNNAHIEQLCTRLDLGRPLQLPSSLAGGFHHRVWRLETERGIFVVKQLAPDTDLKSKAVISHYNVTETIASKFAERGLSTVSALCRDGMFLQVIDMEAYLVFPWTDSVALKSGVVSAQHALAVATLLAKMHCIDLKVLGVEIELAHPSGEDDVDEMFNMAAASDLAVTPLLNEQRSLLMRVARQYQEALPLLERRQVISHGDMDQKNVLWDIDNNPVIIDWESAHRINPTQEVVSVALEWCGITTHLDHTLYSRFLSAYTRAGGTIAMDLVEAALHCELGKWLDWLLYNIGRLVNLESLRQHALGQEQVEFIVPVMVRLDRLVPLLTTAH
jgi:Ser/Thr protein kinase RdoA (MazF antagonist)